MKRVRLSERVLDELDDISEYTVERWGKAQAKKYIAELKTRFRWLAQNPYLGRARDEIRPGLRSFPQGRHIVFYRVEDKHVTILGLPYDGMDIEAYFKRGD